MEQNKIMSNKKNEIQQQLYSLKESSKRSHFTFDDLYPGGALENHVGIFTYLPTVECNKLYLEALNYSEACDADDGDWCARI